MFMTATTVVAMTLLLLPACTQIAQDPVRPLGQADRPSCSVPLKPVDLTQPNANWGAGLLAESEWIWSGQIIPEAFPNNLGKYFLHLPAVFEEQLDFSTTLIFDEPSFRNGEQMSGFVDRVTRELVISFIAQRRRSWYSMTHHAVLGTLTALKHGVSKEQTADKWSRLLDYRDHGDTYTRVERAALRFAEAFATNPKAYSDVDYGELREALTEDNLRRYGNEARWMATLRASRSAHSRVLGLGGSEADASAAAAKAAAAVDNAMPAKEIARKVDSQVVELAFLCLQFVALTDMFTALNVPDEEGLAAVMSKVLDEKVITRINELNRLGGEGLTGLVPPPVALPTKVILDGKLSVDPPALSGSRVPLVSWELDPSQGARDKGVALGGIQVGVYGWSFGSYFPGGLTYLLMHHPELARHEAPYSLPLLFNEDEWRNGSQTSGFVDRLVKELAFLKIYQTTRSRYGLEHHTMFLFNEYARRYGTGLFRDPSFSDEQATAAMQRTAARVRDVVLHLARHDEHPEIYSELERALLTWVEAVIKAPHGAHRSESTLRQSLDRNNRAEVGAGLRRLDTGSGLSEDAAYAKLLNHQIAELAMLVGHMDGLGRIFTILRIEGEKSVPVEQVRGMFGARPGIHEFLKTLGVPNEVLTAHELLVNPPLASERGAVTSDRAAKSGEF